MNYRLSLILSVSSYLTSLTAGAQIAFEPGYFIDNNDQKTECLIRNRDWLDNPTVFQYKLLQGDEVFEGDVTTVKEFSVNGYSKFLRVTVQLDTSNYSQHNALSNTRSPQWSKRSLFLKEVLQGSTGLYSYQTAGLLAFFYYTPKDPIIRQLVHKLYYTPEGKVGENFYYKQQLANEVACDEKQSIEARQIVYNQSSLSKYFIGCNKCFGDLITSEQIGAQTGIADRQVFTMKVTPGISYGRIQYDGREGYIDYGSKLSLRLGLDVEYILPFNKNTWSIFLEPTYQYYDSKATYRYGRISSVNFKSIEFPIGFRHYLFLKRGRGFVNVGVKPGFLDITNSKFQLTFRDEEINPSISFLIGWGYSIGLFSIETRLYTNDDLLSQYTAHKGRYYRMALILGIRFVDVRKKS